MSKIAHLHSWVCRLFTLARGWEPFAHLHSCACYYWATWPRIHDSTKNNGTSIYSKKGWAPLQFWLPFFFTHHMDIYKIFVPFTKGLGTDTPERVRLPPKNAQNLAHLKHVDTFGCKKGWTPLQFWLLSACTHHMRYIWYWYYLNESIYHPRMSIILPIWNR